MPDSENKEKPDKEDRPSFCGQMIFKGDFDSDKENKT